MRQNNFDKLMESALFFCIPQCPTSFWPQVTKEAVKLIETVQEVPRNSEEAGIFEN